MTEIVNSVPTNELLNPATGPGMARLTTSWMTLMGQLQRICLGETLSGPSADRPTRFLYVGLKFFDTSLGANGKPIWVASVSGGVATWIDATSTVV